MGKAQQRSLTLMVTGSVWVTFPSETHTSAW
jgi:hypothetical protein